MRSCILAVYVACLALPTAAEGVRGIEGPVALRPGGSELVVVRKVLASDCRVVRGFLGTPVDGSVGSWDYRGRVREYPNTASDGVVYSYNHNDGVHVTLEDDEGFDVVVLRGGARARLYVDAEGILEPEQEVPLWIFRGGEETAVVRFDERVAARRVSLFGIQDGTISDISFYRMERQKPGKIGMLALWTAGGPAALTRPESAYAPEGIYPAMQERYAEGEREALALVRGVGMMVPLRAQGGRALHFVSPPLQAEEGLTSVTLDMQVSGASGPVSFSAVVQDPLNPRLDLVWTDFSVEAPGQVRLTLDIPDQVLAEGSRLWISLRFGRDVVLSSSRGGAPEFWLKFCPREEALPQALAWRKFLMRTFFSLLSEPRPWGRYGDVSREAFFSSSRYAGQCPELFMTIDQCHALHPADNLVRQYREWVYLRNLKSLSEVAPPPAPPQGTPDWAWYPRLAWLEVRRIADWWLRERLAPTGEFGGRVGDDSDFYQQFADLPFFEHGGVAEKMRDGAARMAELADRENLRDGVNIHATDALHAYEEGINHLALMARWFYGDPIYFERCMASARNVARLTVVTEDGRRHFPDFRRMGYEDLEQPREPAVDGQATPLMWHTAFQVADYNRNPQALKVLRQWADTWLRLMAPGRWATEVEVATGRVTGFQKDRPLYGGYRSQASTFVWLYGLTGEARYLRPFMDYYRQGEAPYPSNDFLGDVYRLGGLERLAPAVLDSLTPRNAALALYRDRGFQGLVGKAVGNPGAGQAGIDDIYDARRWPDMFTAAEPFTDRIFPNLLQPASVSYLGGFCRRNKFNPTLAASWEGFGTDYGALVVENRRDRLKTLVYSYANSPMKGKMRVWNLAHGRYRLTLGLGGDGQADRTVWMETVELAKAGAVDVTLQPGQVTVVGLEQIEKLAPVYGRADLAIAAREVTVGDSVVSGSVHNIGSAAVSDVEIAVVTASGEVVAQTSLGRLAAPLDLMPRRIAFSLAIPDGLPRNCRLVLDPQDRVPEIYEGNNEVALDALPAVDYSKGWE